VIAGIILAAGSSSRLGRPKQLLSVGGAPLIRHTVRRALQSSLDEVLVVVGFEGEAVRRALGDLPVRIVENPEAASGQSTSVVAGIEALQELATPTRLGIAIEAVVFLLGDQPGVEPKVIDALVAAWHETRAPVVAPRYTGGIGNPVLFDRRVFPELIALGGDVGARAIVRKYHAAGDLVLVPVDHAAPPDVDTEADYAALLQSFSGDVDERR
jgi:molybdenum cofactor cytidylyltransferase